MKYVPIRIHCWGGFGSQLFALLQYRQVSRRYKRRKILLVFHSSGVTRRACEIEHFLDGVNWQFVDDFINSEMYREVGILKDGKLNLKSRAESVGKCLLLNLGFVSRLESKSDFMRLRPWLISIRGHYSHFEYEQETFVGLISDFQKLSTRGISHLKLLDSLVIQYRLGDLLNLSSKNPLDPRTLRRAIKYVTENMGQNEKIIILSDSSGYVAKLRKDIGYEFTTSTLPPIDTVLASLEAKYFVGTNSKLSLLITALRSIIGKQSLLPETFRKQIDLWFPNSHLVKFYS